MNLLLEIMEKTCFTILFELKWSSKFCCYLLCYIFRSSFSDCCFPFFLDFSNEGEQSFISVEDSSKFVNPYYRTRDISFRRFIFDFWNISLIKWLTSLFLKILCLVDHIALQDLIFTKKMKLARYPLLISHLCSMFFYFYFRRARLTWKGMFIRSQSIIQTQLR